jgi:UDP-N-acetylmuramoylalanine--D-glutamate ligase
MKLSRLVDMRVLVWGGAREGRAAAETLVRQGCTTAFVTDSSSTDATTVLAARDLDLPLLSIADAQNWKADFVVRSPGVSRYRDEFSDIPSSGLLALWLADQEPSRIIGVTGTKGKSTTSTLIAAILRHAGHSVELAGNIGRVVTDTDASADFVVVEVSSYQASDCTTSPAIGVLTTLGADHIPWHGSLEKYHVDKTNLFAHPELRHIVFHSDDATVASQIERLGISGRQFDNSRHSVHVALATPEGESALERMGSTTFPRNLELAMNAALAADGTLTLAHLLSALDDTVPLPSRQQQVAVKFDRRFVDDALASNPLGVIAAIDRFDAAPFVLIMGGNDRNVDYSHLCDAVNRAENLRSIVVLGGTSSRLYSALLTTKCPVIPVTGDDVHDAVRPAVDAGKPGDRIVFSPGAPTPPHLGDYEIRSARFREAIEAL